MSKLSTDVKLEKLKNELQERIERIKANESRQIEADKIIVQQHMSMFDKSIDRGKEFSLLFLRTLVYANFGAVTAIASALVAYLARVGDVRWELLQLAVVPVVLFLLGGLLALACVIATWANHNAWATSYSRWDQYHQFMLKKYDAKMGPANSEGINQTFRGAIFLGALSVFFFFLGGLRLTQIALYLK